MLNTGNAVVMPWLKEVQGVLEAWYPGEEDGTAVAKVLTGAVDPSGRLPITFPTSAAAQPITSAEEFPGLSDRVRFGTGTDALDIGYRWYQAHEVAPLSPFGFGLAYTSFRLSDSSVQTNGERLVVRVKVSNTGTQSGADIVQLYVGDPPSANEPPRQLRSFTRVALARGNSQVVTLSIPVSSLEAYLRGSFELIPGNYRVGIGQSSSDLVSTDNVALG